MKITVKRAILPTPIEVFPTKPSDPAQASPIEPNSSNTINFKTRFPRTPRVTRSDTIADKKEKYIAAMLTNFKNLVELAAGPAGDGDSKEIAAAHALQMEVESNALVPPMVN